MKANFFLPNRDRNTCAQISGHLFAQLVVGYSKC